MGKRGMARKETCVEDDLAKQRRETLQTLAYGLAKVLHSEISSFCYARQAIPEPGQLVVELAYVEGINSLPVNSAVVIFDSQPHLPPIAGNQEFANAVYEGEVANNGSKSYRFRVNPGSKIIAMLSRKTYRTYDADRIEIRLPDSSSVVTKEVCAPTPKKSHVQLRFKPQTLDEQLSSFSRPPLLDDGFF